VHTFLIVLNKHYMFRRRSRRSSFTRVRGPRNNARFREDLELFFIKAGVIITIIGLVYGKEVSERSQLVFELLNFLIQSERHHFEQEAHGAHLQTSCPHSPNVVLVLSLQDFHHIHR
jgi:hypothetical protein